MLQTITTTPPHIHTYTETHTFLQTITTAHTETHTCLHISLSHCRRNHLSRGPHLGWALPWHNDSSLINVLPLDMKDAPHWTPGCCWVQELTTLPCKQSQKCRLIVELPCLESSSGISSWLCQNCLRSTQNLQHPAVAFLPWLATVSLVLEFPVGCWGTATIGLTPLAPCSFSLLYLGPDLLSYSFIWKLPSPPRSLLSYYWNLPASSPALLPSTAVCMAISAGIWDSSTQVCRVFQSCNIPWRLA